MNEEDQTAFIKWYYEVPYKTDYHASPDQLMDAWQSAIEYKQKEIDELKEKLQASDAVVDFFYESTKKVGW